HFEMIDLDVTVRLKLVPGVGTLARFQLFLHRLQRNLCHVAALVEITDLIKHIGHTTRHASGEVAAGLAKHDDGAAGHVFAAVITHALDHCGGAGVAHRETLAADAGEVHFAFDRTVQHGVSDDDVV